MSDLLVQVRVKNARLYRAIMATGCKTVAEFCRKFMFHYTQVNALIAMRDSPLKRGKDGFIDWRPIVYFISSAVQKEPEEIFPQWLAKLEEVRQPNAIEMSVDEFTSDVLLNKKINKALESLTAREQDILGKRFWEDRSLHEIGRDYDVSHERIRQIEAKGLRKLMHPSRLGSLAHEH